jgi:hypothetical protein
MVFIETPLFASRATKLLSEDDVSALQTMLMLRPDVGDVIPGSGGVRKVRVPAKGKGKSGGARVIYYWVQADGRRRRKRDGSGSRPGCSDHQIYQLTNQPSNT